MKKRTVQLISFAFLLVFALVGCQPKVGSEKWCENLKAQLDEELTFDGGKQYAKHCLLK